jgi:hypothetical protein
LSKQGYESVLQIFFLSMEVIFFVSLSNNLASEKIKFLIGRGYWNLDCTKHLVERGIKYESYRMQFMRLKFKQKPT